MSQLSMGPVVVVTRGRSTGPLQFEREHDFNP